MRTALSRRNDFRSQLSKKVFCFVQCLGRLRRLRLCLKLRKGSALDPLRAARPQSLTSLSRKTFTSAGLTPPCTGELSLYIGVRNKKAAEKILSRFDFFTLLRHYLVFAVLAVSSFSFWTQYTSLNRSFSQHASATLPTGLVRYSLTNTRRQAFR